jgi:hypothetical protein
MRPDDSTMDMRAMSHLLESLVHQGIAEQPDPPMLLVLATACLFLTRFAVRSAVKAVIPRRHR